MRYVTPLCAVEFALMPPLMPFAALDVAFRVAGAIICRSQLTVYRAMMFIATLMLPPPPPA